MNRNPVKHVFLTWPKTPITKDDLLKVLLDQFELKYACVVVEPHKDGTPHLHALIQFSNSYSCPRVIKKFKPLYPNNWKSIHVRPVKNWNNSLAYLTEPNSEKTVDNNPLIWGDYRAVPKLKAATKFARSEKSRLLHDPQFVGPWSSCLAAELKRYSDSVIPNRKFNNLEEVYVFFHEYLPEIGMDIEEYNAMS